MVSHLLESVSLSNIFTVGDPVFPKGSANLRGGCADLLFGNIFDKNCIKVKEFRLRGRKDEICKN